MILRKEREAYNHSASQSKSIDVKKLVIMKRNYIYLACMTVCMFALFAISSCSNEMDMPSSKIEHLQKMKQLCAQYGWTQIEGVSQEEVDKFLLSEDYEKTKEFFEFVKTGGETINLTDLSQVSQQSSSSTRASGVKLTYVLRGQHSSHVATSTTEMIVWYNRKELDVVSTKVHSNPSCTMILRPNSEVVSEGRITSFRG